MCQVPSGRSKRLWFALRYSVWWRHPNRIPGTSKRELADNCANRDPRCAAECISRRYFGIVRIRGADKVTQIEEIAKVPGIDVLFCGPFDLGNNIGHPILDGTMHDELKEAIAKIQRAAKANNKASGIYATSGDQARQYADQGFQMVSVATDAASLPASMQSALTTARGSYVHSALNIAKGAFRSH